MNFSIPFLHFKVLDFKFLDMPNPSKGKGKCHKKETQGQTSQSDDLTTPYNQTEAMPDGSKQSLGSQEDSQSTNLDTQASSQIKKKQRIPPIEFSDDVMDALFTFMEATPVLWSNEKQYAFQKKQRREEAWKKLQEHLQTTFPDHNPEEFTCKYLLCYLIA